MPEDPAHDAEQLGEAEPEAEAGAAPGGQHKSRRRSGSARPPRRAAGGGATPARTSARPKTNSAWDCAPARPMAARARRAPAAAPAARRLFLMKKHSKKTTPRQTI